MCRRRYTAKSTLVQHFNLKTPGALLSFYNTDYGIFTITLLCNPQRNNSPEVKFTPRRGGRGGLPINAGAWRHSLPRGAWGPRSPDLRCPPGPQHPRASGQPTAPAWGCCAFTTTSWAFNLHVEQCPSRRVPALPATDADS